MGVTYHLGRSGLIAWCLIWSKIESPRIQMTMFDQTETIFGPWEPVTSLSNGHSLIYGTSGTFFGQSSSSRRIPVGSHAIQPKLTKGTYIMLTPDYAIGGGPWKKRLPTQKGNPLDSKWGVD